MAAAPCRESPPVTAAPACSDPAPHPASNSAALLTTASTFWLFRIAPPLGHYVAFPQPCRKQRQSGGHVDDSGRNPHDQSADLLVLKRRQSPHGSGGRIGRINYNRSERKQSSEYAGVNCGCENVDDSRPVARAAAAVEQSPPEEKGGNKKAEMLRGMDPFAT